MMGHFQRNVFIHLCLRVTVPEKGYRIRRVISGGRGDFSPARFQILSKNALISVIYELNVSFKVGFSRVSRTSNQRFSPMGPFFFVLKMILYGSALIPRKLPCPKKPLITRLSIYHVRLFDLAKL